MRLVAVPFSLALFAVGCATDIGEHVGGRPSELRPDSPGTEELFKYAPDDVVESHDSDGGRFRVHFTRSGRHRVPATDADGSGVPDYVELVADTYEEVATFYEETLGFRSPPRDGSIADDNGGNDRFDVYLVDFGSAADGSYRQDQCDGGTCIGYMVQENDFAGYAYASLEEATRILASHEYFHAVQAAYDVGQGAVLGEGTAVWASEQFDPSTPDLERFVDGYFAGADRPLNRPPSGPVVDFTYGSAIFFQFLHERFGDDVVRRLWEACVDGANGQADPDWFAVLDGLLREGWGSSFAEAFSEFARWNVLTSVRADPVRSYAGGAGYPPMPMEALAAPGSVEALRLYPASAQYWAVPVTGQAELGAAIAPAAGEDATGVELWMAADRGSTVGEMVRAEDPIGGATVNVEGADTLRVWLVRTDQDGSSKRPSLCVGDRAALDGCLEGYGTTPPPPAEGGDGGVMDGPAETGGCRAAPTGGDGLPWALAVWVLLGLGLSRRRR